ncbi:MAG: glycerate 2-kinase [Thermoplasmata archaeon]|nr:glycerate 2-kinase [Thermoplasmata archaeon]
MAEAKDTHAPLHPGGPHAEAAVDAFLAGLAAVDPTVLVRKAVRQGLLDDWFFEGGRKREDPRPLHVLALGKAAPRMLWGLVEGGVPFKGLGVAPKGVAAPGVDTFEWLPGDHPIPGEASFAAGRRVLDWARAIPEGAPVLVLLSGGASACAEVPDGLTEAALQARWRDLLRSGKPIEAVNAERAGLSALKGGKLGRALLERSSKVRAWLLADTDPATAAAAVGSGPVFQAEAPARIPHHVLASADAMVGAAGLRLASLGYDVYRHPDRIRGPAEDEVRRFLDGLASLPGDRRVALVGGGECTVELPADAPQGGRCQHAALLAAERLSVLGGTASFMACASDGKDGSTDAAGAVVTAADAGPEATAALRGFSSHRLLDARGRLVHTGATGTNVNDLWVALG